MKEVINNIIRYEAFISVGLLIALGSLLKLIHVINLSSDWFWFLAGVGLVCEGIIALVKQKKFDRKYKIIEVNQ
jgi:hypothetical protein